MMGTNGRDRTVVITGASSGFGRGVAERFAKDGMNVVLAARREELIEELAQQCEKRGGGQGSWVGQNCTGDDQNRRAAIPG